MSGALSIEEVLRLVQDNEEEVSDDEEDLVGDFVGENGQPQLLFNQALGIQGGNEDDYIPLDRSEPCFRSSLLLLDQSLLEVSELGQSSVNITSS